ncbi:MAG: aminotransferase class V-fold PLP-dependent enzyme [Saprospiraceae bacterium]
MLDCQSEKFSLPTEVSYLNCAYMSPLLNTVASIGEFQVKRKGIPYTISLNDFFDPLEELKQSFAKLVNIENPSRIAPIPSASYGLSTVARNLRVKPGFNIVVLEEQFPSNYYPWERLAKEKAGEIRVVRLPAVPGSRSLTWTEAILDQLDENTALLAMSHTHWADGTQFDLLALRQKTKDIGALLVIDGTQSVGALPFDVAEIQPDALICAGYKWLLGPYSLGLGYFGPYFDEGVPIEENWINRQDSDDFKNLVTYQSQYKPFAHRYGVGEQSNFILVPMLKAAIDQLLDWGVANIQQYCLELSASPVEQLRAMGCQIEEEKYRSGHLFGVRLPKHLDGDKLQQLFAAHQVFVSFRGSAVRVSPHLYNNEGDFTTFIKCFEQCFVPKLF